MLTANIIKKKSRLVFVAILTLGACLTADASPLSQPEALSLILTNNPTLKAASRTAAAQLPAARTASQLQGPEIEGAYMFAPRGEKDKWEVGISQGFNWPSSYKARREAAQAEALVSTAQYEVERSRLATEARLAMAQGVYLRSKINLYTSLYTNLDSVAGAIQYGYDHGQLTILDLKKVKLEQFKMKNLIQTTELEIERLKTSLAQMAGTPTLDVDFSAYTPLPLESLESYISACENSPEIRLLRLQTSASHARSHAHVLESNPTFALGYRHAYEDGAHFNGVTLSIGLPLWGHDYENDYLLSLASIFENQATDTSKALMADLTGQHAIAEKSRLLLNEYQAVLLDKEYPELWTLAYTGGQINVITLIQELNYYLEASEQYLDTDYQYRQALINLNRFSEP